MQWIRTVVVFDRGNIIEDPEWLNLHEGYKEAIRSLVHPPGTNDFTLRRKARKLNAEGRPTSQWNRNGVTPIKRQFLERMAADGWVPEQPIQVNHNLLHAVLRTFPDRQPFEEAIRSNPGEFDFYTTTDAGLKAAIEWETGNISSSHRSLNKLCLCMMTGQLDVGVLIVPSRACYEHLTDRVGNWNELGPYLPYWHTVSNAIGRGLLAVSVVEHDNLTDDPAVPYIAAERQGRAEEGAARIV